MKSLFDDDAFQEITERLNELNAKDAPKWGKMNAPQMLLHCQKAFEIPLGLTEGMTPNIIMRLLLKSFKTSMYNDKPWRHNLPTPKAFQITEDKDFNLEKAALLKIAEEFRRKGISHDWPKHPAFGFFTAKQWGQMQYKHLDHHCRQFGV